MYKSEAFVRVRYEETDQMGVGYNGNYFTWFEVGRNEFFRSLGYTYKDLEISGVILPVIEANCKYIHAAKYDDELGIETRITMLKGVRLKFEYNVIRKADRVILAKGFTIHAFVSRDLKPLNFKKANPEIWNLLNDKLEKGE
ncbi:MAG: acyl-CoA thioesterase [Anaeromicrobium sp.]|jgi:acyl-CoA thioester hydrolase|uniref:acyl-CoA thioesterase n=1 Tax=Anaeromicrobium sp. TaxID=1929132 RepID=UPI0025D3AC2F|nr:thioesterase family protein [Anaeromicrobium sp.]MCT4593704.1 acyl-CoA thioesterase [Anaeromicrobium sp.]